MTAKPKIAVKLPPRLVDELPEVADRLERRLRSRKLDALAETVSGLRIHANENGQLYFTPPESIKRPPSGPHAPVEDPARWSYMHHPNRRRYWLGFAVVEVIDGRIAVASVNGLAQ